MITAVLVMVAIAGTIGLALGIAALRLPHNEAKPVDAVNRLLPQTQCAQCGYPGCLPYAQAVLDGTAEIDQCAPGGKATVTALANLLGQTPRPVNPLFGQQQEPAVAEIDESRCIGCVLCIAACPVDAIVGAAQFTHTVIRSECTGCELCLAPCPVDCISLKPRNRRQAA